MAQGKRQVRGRRGSRHDSMELLNVCISQRRHDSYGRRLKVFHLDELSEMSPAELGRVKADGFLALPDLLPAKTEL